MAYNDPFAETVIEELPEDQAAALRAELAEDRAEEAQTMTAGRGKVQVCTTVSQEFWNKAHEYRIKWSEAMRVGLSLMFAERGDAEYGELPKVVQRKIIFLQQEVQARNEEIDKLRLEAKDAEERLKNLRSGQA